MRLNDQKVSEIKKLIVLDKLPQPEIASLYGVSRSLISDIATGRAHKDVAWPEGCPLPKKAGGQHKPIGDYNPTDERIMELESEIVHLTEERNRERIKVKAGAKIAGLFKAIKLEMDQRIKPFAALPNLYQFKAKANGVNLGIVVIVKIETVNHHTQSQ